MRTERSNLNNNTSAVEEEDSVMWWEKGSELWQSNRVALRWNREAKVLEAFHRLDSRC